MSGPLGSSQWMYSAADFTIDQSLRFNAGGSAHLVDPFDIADIENGFKKVISDANYRHELINKGKLNRQKYLPEAVASQYFHLYKNFFK